jgi:hypothetical protein
MLPLGAVLSLMTHFPPLPVWTCEAHGLMFEVEWGEEEQLNQDTGRRSVGGLLLALPPTR